MERVMDWHDVAAAIVTAYVVTARLATDFDGRTVPSERAMYGGRTVGVPGVVMALEHAHRRFGFGLGHGADVHGRPDHCKTRALSRA